MTGLVQGVKALFVGPDTSAQDAAAAEAAKSREQQQIALDRQQQSQQVQQQTVDQQAGAGLRQPKGRRLLLAATGEAGLNGTLGG